MSIRKIKVIVVGVGHLGKEHARIYRDMEYTELVGIVDKDFQQATLIAKKLEVPCFKSIEEINCDYEAASVVVPTIYHFEIAKQLIEKGIHVLVEKPFTQTLNEAYQLLELAHQKQVKISVGHIERFNPAFMKIEQILKRPRFIEVHRLGPFPNRATDVGVVLDLMIHDIDIILNIVDSKIKDIRAVGIPVLTQFEDIANARLEFENGCVANITASRVSLKRMRKIRIFQKDLYMSLDYQKQKGRMTGLIDGKMKSKRIPINKSEPLWIELEHFMQSLLTGQSPKVSALHGVHALEAAIQISEQIRQAENSTIQ